MKILYLGLDPSRFPHEGELYHLPLIEICPRPFSRVQEAFMQLPAFSHVLFTSRSAVPLFITYARQAQVEVADKHFIAIGAATAALLQDYGLRAHTVAASACAEGVVATLEQLAPFSLFFPHAAAARSLITHYLQQRGLSHLTVALYDTHFIFYPSPPSLDSFTQIVFTSPSTVKAFVALYGQLPVDKILTPIGPITAKCLDNFLPTRYPP